MSEKASVVPEVFYDVIARFVPGTVFLLGLLSTIPECRESFVAPLKGLSEVLTVPIALVGTWTLGFLFSVASQPIEAVYGRGVHPITYALGVPMTPKNKLYAAIEFLAGMPVLLLTYWLMVKYQFDEHIQRRIRDRIEPIFGCDILKIPFWLLFDYARTRGCGVSASGVVKVRAEATCARSLMLVFLVLGGLTLCRIPGLLTVLGLVKVHTLHPRPFATPVVFFVLASLSSAALSHYRIQERHRVLFVVYNCLELQADSPCPTPAPVAAR